MAYTIPEHVDTKEQAVLALASTIADEDKSALGNGSVNKALDILADVLAQQDVSVPQTNAGAILALAQYVTGGGGGGDFSTCTVTITNESSAEFSLAAPYIYDGVLGSVIYLEDWDVMDGIEFEIALYGNGTYLDIIEGGGSPDVIAGTGGVHVVDNSIYVTGDGTLTFSDEAH